MAIDKITEIVGGYGNGDEVECPEGYVNILLAQRIIDNRAEEQKQWIEKEDREREIDVEIIHKFQQILDENDGEVSAQEIWRCIVSNKIPHVTINY